MKPRGRPMSVPLNQCPSNKMPPLRSLFDRMVDRGDRARPPREEKEAPRRQGRAGGLRCRRSPTRSNKKAAVRQLFGQINLVGETGFEPARGRKRRQGNEAARAACDVTAHLHPATKNGLAAASSIRINWSGRQDSNPPAGTERRRRNEAARAAGILPADPFNRATKKPPRGSFFN